MRPVSPPLREIMWDEWAPQPPKSTSHPPQQPRHQPLKGILPILGDTCEPPTTVDDHPRQNMGLARRCEHGHHHTIPVQSAHQRPCRDGKICHVRVRPRILQESQTRRPLRCRKKLRRRIQPRTSTSRHQILRSSSRSRRELCKDILSEQLRHRPTSPRSPRNNKTSQTVRRDSRQPPRLVSHNQKREGVSCSKSSRIPSRPDAGRGIGGILQAPQELSLGDIGGERSKLKVTSSTYQSVYGVFHN